MNSINPQLNDQPEKAPVVELSKRKTTQVVEVAGAAKWEVYHRLQELQIPCQCRAHQPLQVQVYSPLAAIQIWSVVRQVITPRNELTYWLESCWQMDSNIKDF